MYLYLKEIRKRKGMSQGDLAREIGTTVRVVGSWERQDTSLPLEDACKLCNVLGCTPNDLCGMESVNPSLSKREYSLLENYRVSDPASKTSIDIIAANSAAAAKRERTRQQRPPGGASGSCDAETA